MTKDRAALTREDIDQIIDGIENFCIGPIEDEECRAIWQPYVDKLAALRDGPAEAELQRLREENEMLKQERDRLRAALVGIIGAGGRAELEQIEVGLRLMPVPAEDKARSIDGIHALLATLKE